MRIVEIGAPLEPKTSLDSVTVPLGCKAVFPINDDGMHMEWGLTAPGLKRAIEDGYVRVTPGRNKHQAFTISYLTGPQRKKIKAGELVVTGTREDGSRIVVLPAGKSVRWTTTWRDKAHDAGAYGTSLLGQIVPGRRFPYPKSLYAVEDCLRLFLKKKTNAIVLDFFAGSGTTGQAVMRLNRDGGRRRFILVSNNEASSDEESLLAANGLEPGSEQWEAAGIFETILWPRIKAAVTGRRPDGGKVDGNYTFGDEFPMSDGFEENAAYFKLNILDAADVTRGEKFESIVPILWMLAGCRGACELSKGAGKWFMPENNPYAVLLKEDAFLAFMDKLRERPDIDHVFLVTDSTEAFHEMAADLGRGYKSIQLYRSYIDTFRINLTEPGTLIQGVSSAL